MFQVWQIRQQNNAFSDVERAGNLFALLGIVLALLSCSASYSRDKPNCQTYSNHFLSLICQRHFLLLRAHHPPHLWMIFCQLSSFLSCPRPFRNPRLFCCIIFHKSYWFDINSQEQEKLLVCLVSCCKK